MATLGAETIGLFCKFYIRFVNENELLTVLGVVMLLVALTAGCATLILTPVATRISKTPPPQIIVHVAYIAGALPLVDITAAVFHNGHFTRSVIVARQAGDNGASGNGSRFQSISACR